MCVCVCVCVCARARAGVCVCVCVVGGYGCVCGGEREVRTWLVYSQKKKRQENKLQKRHDHKTETQKAYLKH